MAILVRLIKALIPYYLAYSKSVKSGIHNQSYWNYVKFRISGKCNKWGGIFQSILHVPSRTLEKYLLVLILL